MSQVKRSAVVVGALLTAVLLGFLAAPTASASPHETSFGAAVSAVTTPTGDLVAFTDRDVVRVEGFADHAGQTGVVDVSRDGRVIGSALGVVGGGDVAFAVGAPGGPCWGVGTAAAGVPDVRPGDVVTLSFGATRVAQTVVGGATLDPVTVLNGTTLQVSARLAPTVDPTHVEQRVVAPELSRTTVARLDAHAVPGPMRRAARGGYSSQLVVAGSTAVATYVFDDPATAAAAARGAARVMSWQTEGPSGDRHGQTVSEARPAPGTTAAACSTPAPAPFPAPTASTTPDGVALTARPGAEIYFTVDGSGPRTVDLPAVGAARYVAPVVVTHPATTISWVAVDPSGAVSQVGAGVFDPAR